MSDKIITIKDLPNKIRELMEEPYIGEVDKLIRDNKTLNEIRVFILDKGFKISKAYIGKYKKYLLQENTKDKYLSEFIDENRLSKKIFREPERPITKEDKIKSDLVFIDNVIQEGAKRFRDNKEDIPITLYDVFQAISLKDKITGGASYGLTNYGVKCLAQMTEDKYYKIITILMEYIPEDKKEEVIGLVEVAEEDFYKHTEYYEEYLTARGYSREEIIRKMKKNELY